MGLSSLRNDFMCKLEELLGDQFKRFVSLDSFEKSLGCELWGLIMFRVNVQVENTVEPPITDPPNSGPPPNNGPPWMYRPLFP